MYVAIENGYFADEGLDITLVNGSGADNVMTSLISGDADIGFMGPEATVYVYNQGAQNYAVNFAQLTQRAGNFLVAREEEPDFTWQDLKGKTVLGGREGGMPEMIFEYVLTLNNIDPKNDLTIIQNVDFGLTAEAFASGTADYTVEFEPGATSLETGQKGYVVASLGTDSGYIPYTAFSARKSYISEHSDTIQGFVNACKREWTTYRHILRKRLPKSLNRNSRKQTFPQSPPSYPDIMNRIPGKKTNSLNVTVLNCFRIFWKVQAN